MKAERLRSALDNTAFIHVIGEVTYQDDRESLVNRNVNARDASRIQKECKDLGRCQA